MIIKEKRVSREGRKVERKKLRKLREKMSFEVKCLCWCKNCLFCIYVYTRNCFMVKYLLTAGSIWTVFSPIDDPELPWSSSWLESCEVDELPVSRILILAPPTLVEPPLVEPTLDPWLISVLTSFKASWISILSSSVVIFAETWWITIKVTRMNVDTFMVKVSKIEQREMSKREGERVRVREEGREEEKERARKQTKWDSRLEEKCMVEESDRLWLDCDEKQIQI